MSQLFPSILETKGRAFAFHPISGTHDVKLYFEMSENNDINDIRNGHIQVSIKTQSNNLPAVNLERSPDKQTIFIRGNANLPAMHSQTKFLEIDGNNQCVLAIPYFCFDGGNPDVDTLYTIQVRFGTSDLWLNAGATGTEVGQNTVNFADWRRNEVSKVPSGFGEWSNTQTIYCHGAATVRSNYNYHNFVPEVNFSVTSQYDDPIVETSIFYSYTDFYGTHFDTLIVEGEDKGLGVFTIREYLWLAPVTDVLVTIRAVTKNNTVWESTLAIPAINAVGGAGTLVIYTPTGEESEDSVIPMRWTINGDYPVKIFRIDLYTLSAVEVYHTVLDKETATFPREGTFRDYSVENGREYQYILFRDENNITRLYPYGFENPGYGRLTMMPSTYLVDKHRQLRLTGNVNINQLKRNTPDQLQTTLGSKYPFYQRGAKTNYRSFSLSAVISAHFDPTCTFLRYDEENGLYWENNAEAGDNNLQVLNKDLLFQEEFTLSRERLVVNHHHWRQTGARTIYDPRLHKERVRLPLDNKNDETVFVEKVFRDKVMEWLSNGKPKLFRSETEGNMIVMITNSSFTPVDKSARIVYTLSATVTEIADFNSENLRKFDLIPWDLEGYYDDDLGLQFNPGELDPEMQNRVQYIWTPDYNLPVLTPGQPPSALGTYNAVKYGTPPYKFEIVEDLNIGGARIDEIADLIAINPDNGIINIDAVPEGTPEMLPGGAMEVRVTDSSTLTAPLNQDTMLVNFMGVKSKLIAEWQGITGSIARITEKQVGDEIDYRINIFGGTPPYAISSESLFSGINVEMIAPNEARVYGLIESPNSLIGLQAKIIILDSFQQRAELQLAAEEIVYPIEAIQSIINIPEMNVGENIIPISIEGKVQHGLYNNPASHYSYQWIDRFGAVTTNPIPGLGISTGTIQGAPTIEQESGMGLLRVTADNPGTLPNSSTVITVYFGKTYNFRWVTPSATVRYPLDADTAIDVGYFSNSAQVGIDAEPAPFVFPYVIGGEQPYTFRARYLLPFKISLQGEVSGIATGAQDARTATLIAIDARGREITTPVQLPQIRGALTLKPGVSYDLGDLKVGQNISIPTFKPSDFDNITGQLHYAGATNTPPGLHYNSSFPFSFQPLTVAGAPAQAADPSEIHITVEDDSNPVRRANVIIQVGTIYRELERLDGFTTPDTGFRQDLFPIKLRNLTHGGSGDFEYTIQNESQIEPYILSPDGILYGNSGSMTRPRRTARITVTDLIDGRQVHCNGIIGSISPLHYTVTTATIDQIHNTTGGGYSANLGQYATGGQLPYRFSLFGAPAGMIVNSSTGVVSGSWPAQAESGGNSIFCTTDATGAVIYLNFRWGYRDPGEA